MAHDKSVCHFRCIWLLIIYMITGDADESECYERNAMKWQNMKQNGISYYYTSSCCNEIHVTDKVQPEYTYGVYEET